MNFGKSIVVSTLPMQSFIFTVVFFKEIDAHKPTRLQQNVSDSHLGFHFP